jgi:hypothetical protein
MKADEELEKMLGRAIDTAKKIATLAENNNISPAEFRTALPFLTATLLANASDATMKLFYGAVEDLRPIARIIAAQQIVREKIGGEEE